MKFRFGSTAGKQFLIGITLCCAVLAVYSQTGHFEFINLDDDQYIYENPQILRGLTAGGIVWAFESGYSPRGNPPLASISHMIDVELFGLSSGWHHRMNVFYHLLNTLLLFLVLTRLTGAIPQSSFVAALFALHPLHVESVAWVTERKDVLSTLFFLLAVAAYARYVRKPSAGRYLHVALLFTLGLLSKPMIVTLPFVLLLLDVWPLGRTTLAGGIGPAEDRISGASFGRLILEKGPLLFLSIATSAIMIQATSQAQNLDVSLRFAKLVPFATRFSNALWSYVAYLIKLAWPSSLAVFYPLLPIPFWKVIVAILLLLSAGVTVSLRIRHSPYLFVGWCWFAGTLIPVAGFVQYANQFMADRYTYLPSIGIFIMLAWGVGELREKFRISGLAVGFLSAIVVAILSIASWVQVGYWVNNDTLYRHAIQVTNGNWVAHYNLGASLAKEGRWSDAIQQFIETLKIHPFDDDAHKSLGAAYSYMGDLEKSLAHYRMAVMISPYDLGLRNDYAVVMGKAGRSDEAEAQLREALRIAPDSPETLNNMAGILESKGDFEGALDYAERALLICPNEDKFRKNVLRLVEKTSRYK